MTIAYCCSPFVMLLSDMHSQFVKRKRKIQNVRPRILAPYRNGVCTNHTLHRVLVFDWFEFSVGHARRASTTCTKRVTAHAKYERDSKIAKDTTVLSPRAIASNTGRPLCEQNMQQIEKFYVSAMDHPSVEPTTTTTSKHTTLNVFRRIMRKKCKNTKKIPSWNRKRV